LITITAATADKHCGSGLGLCPRYFERTDGDAYRSNKGQQWAYSKWKEYWKDVADLKIALQQSNPDERVIVWALNVGDDADKDQRGVERAANNPADVLRLAVAVHEPMVNVSDFRSFVRGTISHQGRQGWLQELLGEDCGAVQHGRTEAFSSWHIRATVSGVSVDAYHRPKTRGTLPHTENLAPPRMANIISARCAEAGVKPPDLVFFGHTHYFGDSSTAKKPRVIFLPGWQLPYDWVHSVGLGMHPPAIGGVIAVCRDGEVEIIPKLYRPLMEKRWTIT
jgi:hypothetical protein